MQDFKVKVIITIIATSEGKDFLILLDENGYPPSLYIQKTTDFENQLYQKLSEYFDAESLYSIKSTQNIAEIKIEDNELTIYLNFISIFTRAKKGSFIRYNKNSIELHRLVNSKLV